MGKILITGITGNVGMFVYEALEELRQEVVGAVTSIAKSKERFKEIKLVEFDFRDPSKKTILYHPVIKSKNTSRRWVCPIVTLDPVFLCKIFPVFMQMKLGKLTKFSFLRETVSAVL